MLAATSLQPGSVLLAVAREGENAQRPDRTVFKAGDSADLVREMKFSFIFQQYCSSLSFEKARQFFGIFGFDTDFFQGCAKVFEE